MRTRTTVTLVAAALAAAACGSGTTLTAGGAPLDDPDQTIETADSTFASQMASADDIAVDDDARCFFHLVTDTDIADQLYCGPVAVRDGDGPWVTYQLSWHTTDDTAQVDVGANTGTAVSMNDTDQLTRPDGDSPDPDRLTIAPPAEAPDAVFTLDDLPYTLDDNLDGAYVNYPSGTDSEGLPDYDTFRLTATDRLSSFGDGYQQVTAADGHELVVVRTDFDSHVDRAVIVADGTRRPVDALHGRYLVASVPDDAEQVTLEMERDSVMQTLDLESGQRAGEAPAIWYRDTVRDRLGFQFADSHAVSGAEQPSGQPRDFTLHVEFTYTNATLQDRNHEDARPSAGSVWLAVDYADLRSFNEGASFFLDWWFDSNTVLVVDDNEIELSTSHQGRSDGTLFFEVSEDFTEGTLQLRPTGEWEHTGTGSSQVTSSGEFTLEEADIDISISN